MTFQYPGKKKSYIPKSAKRQAKKARVSPPPTLFIIIFGIFVGLVLLVMGFRISGKGLPAVGKLAEVYLTEGVSGFTEYDSYMLGNTFTRVFLDMEGRYAHMQNLPVSNNRIDFNANASWNQLDLDRLRGIGGERYGGYATFILNNKYYQTFIDKEGRYAYTRVLDIANNTIQSGAGKPWSTLDLDRLRGSSGGERYGAYAVYILGNTYFQTFIDKDGRYAYTRSFSIVNGQLVGSSASGWEQTDLDRLRNVGGERYGGYNAYIFNNQFVQTFFGRDGTSSYTRSLNILGNKIQNGTGTSWLVQTVGTTPSGNLLASLSAPLSPVLAPNTIIDTSEYFNFKPGDYWIFRGCIGQNSYAGCPTGNIYEVRMDVENTVDVNMVRNGQPLSLTSNPVRVTTTKNTPVSQMGAAQDYTFFLGNTFNYQGQPIKWGIKTVFYYQTDFPVIRKTQKGTAVFLPQSGSYPPYYFAHRYQDLSSRENHPMMTVGTSDPRFFDGDVSGFTGHVNGWETAYKLVNVDMPKYKGEALRIRFWEYGQENLQVTTAINYDEWLFAKGIGLIGINNQFYRGSETGRVCAADPDCSDQSVVMQKPMYAVSLFSNYHYQDGENVTVQVSKADVFNNYLTMRSGETYKLKVSMKDGTPYNGFLEAEGTIQSRWGTSPIRRQVLRDATGKHVWVKDGIGLVRTGISQKGKFTSHFRPYIYNEKGVELGPNRLGWSSDVTVEVQ